MNIDPKLLSRLQATADGKQLLVEIGKVIDSEDRSSDIEEKDPVLVAVEVAARKRTVKRLLEIFESLNNTDVTRIIPKASSEYDM